MSETQPITRLVAAPPAAGGGGQRRLGLALLVIATAQLMVVLDATIVNVALPHIQLALGFSGSGLEWVVNAYTLTFSGLLLLGGRAGDILGRRRVFIAGILVFSVASLAGGFAQSQEWLLAARALQGVGGAIVAPTALSLISTTFPEGPRRNRAMGVYSAMSIGGAAVGLLAGGLLTSYASWRWVLFVNVPIGIAVAPAPCSPQQAIPASRSSSAGSMPAARRTADLPLAAGDALCGPPLTEVPLAEADSAALHRCWPPSLTIAQPAPIDTRPGDRRGHIFKIAIAAAAFRLARWPCDRVRAVRTADRLGTYTV